MAAEDNFVIRVQGAGGHASRPHECRDALVAAREKGLNWNFVTMEVHGVGDGAQIHIFEFAANGYATREPCDVQAA